MTTDTCLRSVRSLLPTNLQLAIQHIDGLLVKPGQVFSFWDLVGNPTQHRSFKLGMTLQNGCVKTGYGGGLCQLSNWLYWMALHNNELYRIGRDRATQTVISEEAIAVNDALMMYAPLLPPDEINR
jgi:hypothetical protein